MMNRATCAAFLALWGMSSALPAQSSTESREREGRAREAERRAPRAFTFQSRDGATRPRIGIAITSGGPRDTLGLRVESVVAGGPADQAGLREGDRLTAVNGVNLRLAAADADDEDMAGIVARRLTRELGKLEVGDDVELRYSRDGQSNSVKLKTVSAAELQPRRVALTVARREHNERASLGVGLGSSGSRRDTLGVFVSSVSTDGPAEQAGVEEGDRIVAINSVDLRVSAEDAGDWTASVARVRRLQRELEKVKAGDEVELRLSRGGQSRTVRVKTVRAQELEREGNVGPRIMIDGHDALNDASIWLRERLDGARLSPRVVIRRMTTV